MNNLAFDYGNIGKMADMVIIKAYDEHSLSSTPGPVAGKYWFKQSLDTLLEAIPPSKTLIALGLHGYDWNMSTGTPPEKRDFQGTMRLAGNKNVHIQWDPNSENNSFLYIADDGSYHEVWFLDAISMWNQYAVIHQKHIYGTSLHLAG